MNSNGGMVISQNWERKIITGDAGYVLEDVPHLTDYVLDLPVTSSFLWTPCFVFVWLITVWLTGK